MRGRRGAFGTFIDVRGSLATKVDPWTPTVFCVAGVALSAPQARVAWPAWYFRYLRGFSRKLGEEGGPMDADGLFRGRRDTFSASGSICVAGEHLMASANQGKRDTFSTSSSICVVLQVMSSMWNMLTLTCFSEACRCSAARSIDASMCQFFFDFMDFFRFHGIFLGFGT